MDKNKLYVGNVSWGMNSDGLRELFSQFGEITEAVIITDRMSGRSKGFGFVTFANAEDAEKAATEMDQKDVEGRKIVVNVAKPREERSDRGGGNRGGGDFRRDNRNSY